MHPRRQRPHGRGRPTITAMTTPTGVGRLALLQIDCADPARLAAFWAAALGIEVRGQLGDGPQYVFLEVTPEGGPRLCFQRVPESKSSKNRLHFDIHVKDVEAATDRLVSLGASRLPDGDVHEFDIW